MDIVYLNECYKHRWLLDFVTQQIDRLSYEVTNSGKLENRVYTYIGKYLMQCEDNYKNRARIKNLVMQKITESITHYGGFDSELIEGSMDNEKSANLIDCCSNHSDKRLVRNVWIETLAGDNPKHRAIVSAIADGYTLSETALLLTDRFGGKLNGNMTCIKRFRTKCKKNRDNLLNALCI